MKLKKIPKYTYVSEKDKAYLDELEQVVRQSIYLPKYHLYPKTGLMNDPNGLAYFNEKYHVFYQWFPYEPTHGMKHWGHVSSEDLINWEDLGYALIPDQTYEKNGCYSGNALEKDGSLYLFYTGNYKTPLGKQPKQALAIMSSTGEITKVDQNPIIDEIPTGLGREIRDPFVFERQGSYYMLLGGETEKSVGCLLLYQSNDLLDWHYEGLIDLPILTGTMLECPSLIQVDGKDVLFLSPMGYEIEEEKYHNRFASIYLIGELNLTTKQFHLETMGELDAGFDYYAPQAFYGKNHQPLTFGWFGCGEPSYISDQDMWKHGLTVPQQLTIRNNHLYRYPAAEFLQSFKEEEEVGTMEELKLVSHAYSIVLHLPYDKLSKEIKIGYLDDYVSVLLDQNHHQIKVDRSHLKEKVDPLFGEIRWSYLHKEKQKVELTILVDNSFIEVYVNQGEKVFSFRTFHLKPEHSIFLSEAYQYQLAYYK